MKLGIDTTNNLRTRVKIDGQSIDFMYTSPREQNVLGAIKEALNSKKMQFSDITEIEVLLGPGSFTGIRVGVSVAQALSLALDVPINGKSAGSDLRITYDEAT